MAGRAGVVHKLAEIGHYYHVAGIYLARYAQEWSWREDQRRISNGDHVSRVPLVMRAKPSVDSAAIGNGI
jgi:hypothetical protein